MILDTKGLFSAAVTARINDGIDFVDDIGECWYWNKSRFNTGYGCASIDGAAVGVHRVVWEMHNGMAIPEGLLIRHSCDNRACCNPFHLALGTVQDNSNDMVSRNRQAQGEMHGRAKITEKEASIIAASSDSYTVLSERYCLSKASICKIKTGLAWRGSKLKGVVDAKPRAKLDKESAREVFLAPGLQQDIADDFGITQKQVSYIKSGRAWGKATADLRGK